MANSSFWSWLTRNRLPRPARGGASCRRPALEQLGDRTLLSAGIGWGVLSEQTGADLRPALEAFRTILKADDTPARGAREELLYRLEALSMADVPVSSTVAEGGEYTGRGLGGDTLGSKWSNPTPGSIDVLTRELSMYSSGDLVDLNGVAAQIQQVLVSRPAPAPAPDHPAEGGTGAPGEYEREYALPPHPLSDPGVLAILLRTRATDHDERRDASDRGGETEAKAPADARPEAAGLETLPLERNDGTAVSRSLAAAFREESAVTLATIESPAGKGPDLLASYDAASPPPRAELLPLADGGRALVAALVEGVPVDTTAPASDAAALAPALTGVAVGLDSGSPEGDPAPLPAAPAAASATPCGTHVARDASLSDAAFVGDWGRARYVLDAVFIAGLFHLYRYADAILERDGRNGASR
jgi:hypothetical protein